jgi:hypothetical protein
MLADEFVPTEKGTGTFALQANQTQVLLYILDTERMERITDMYAVTYSEN